MAAPKALTKVNRELKKYKNLPGAGVGLGVCAGLAYWVGWPTWIVRIAFLLLLCGFGVGLVAYLLIGFVAPKTSTPNDYDRRTGSA